MARDFSTVGIVFALEIEARGLKQVLAHSRRVRAKYETQSAWQVGTIRVLMTVGGIGREKCAKATESLIDSGARWIVDAGYVAALDGKAQVGDVVVADRLLLRDGVGEALVCDDTLVAAVPPSGRMGYSVWRSALATCDAMILSADAKREVYAATGAAALDMECYAAAEVCKRRGVPLVAIKGVSDTASEDLPDEIRTLAEIESGFEEFAFVLLRPHLWPTLLRIRGNVLKASDNLGDVLGMMLLRLSGS